MTRAAKKVGVKIPPVGTPGRSRVTQSLKDRKKGQVNRREVLGSMSTKHAERKTRRGTSLERQAGSGRQPKKPFQKVGGGNLE